MVMEELGHVTLWMLKVLRLGEWEEVLITNVLAEIFGCQQMEELDEKEKHKWSLSKRKTY